MNCPHCDHPESKVSETRATGAYDRRIRICRGCGKNFQTIERIAVYAGRAAGYIESGPPVLEPEEEPEAKRPQRFVAALGDGELRGVPEEIQPLLVEWWNVSRFSKHGKKAAWTEAAWRQNVRRVAALPHWKQKLLAQAGVESGWQALKPEFMGDVAPPTDEGLAPKSTAMQEAISAWNNRVA